MGVDLPDTEGFGCVSSPLGFVGLRGVQAVASGGDYGFVVRMICVASLWWVGCYSGWVWICKDFG